jgi:hypothetical protein
MDSFMTINDMKKLLLLTFLFASLFGSCQKRLLLDGGTLATVVLNTAQQGDNWCQGELTGEATDDGGSIITERGFVYSITPNPTIANNKIIEGSGLGVFQNINEYEGFPQGSTIYARAYAVNSVGVAYSSFEGNFTTQIRPTSSITSIYDITSSSAKIDVSVSANSNVINNKTIVYADVPLFDPSQLQESGGSGGANYTVTLTSLSPNTTYYIASRLQTDCAPENDDVNTTFTTASTSPEYAETGAIGTTTTTSLSVPFTSTVNSGDALVMLVGTKQNTTISTPTGWTLIGTETNVTNTLTVAWFYKVASGSESGNVGVTIGASGNSAGLIYRYTSASAVDVSNPPAISTQSNSNANATNSTALTGNLGLAFSIAALNETISASGTEWTQDNTKSTSSAGGFSFCTASRLGDGTVSATVTFSWTTNSAAAVFAFLELTKY